MGTRAQPGPGRPHALIERPDRSSRAVGGLALAFFCLTLMLTTYRLSLPTDGWRFIGPDHAPAFEENLLRKASPLRPGDQLLEVDGVPFPALMANAVGLHSSPLLYTRGGTATYTVLRDGHNVTLAVPLATWSLAGVGRVTGRALTDARVGGIYTWLGFLLAVYVFWRRPDSRSAQVFLLLQTVLAAAAVSSAVAVVTVADTLSPVVFYLARTLGSLVFWLLIPPLTLHLILTFPALLPVLRRWWAATLLYGVPWVVFITVWVTSYDPLVFLMLGAYNVLGFSAVVYLVLTVRTLPQRAQVRWFGFGYAVSSLITVLHASWHTQLIPEVPWLSKLLIEDCVCDLVFVTCTAVAILWYRLFDIDVVLNRTLVYGTLTAGVVGLYVGVVGVTRQLLPTAPDEPLAVVATAVVAAVFGPARQLLQQGVNRLLYGERDDPYQVLRTLGGRMGSAPDPGAVLPDVAATIARTLKLPYVRLTLGVGEEARPVAAWGVAQEAVLSLPLTHQGETLGTMQVAPRPGDAFRSSEVRLLGAIAQQVSLAALTVRQYLDLKRARETLVAAREEERRRIRRDLHDGLGPALAGLAIRLDAARNLLGQDPARADALLVELKAQTQTALADIRRLVYALRPPALDELGLEGALREHLRNLDQTISVELDVSGNLHGLPAATEVACYRIAQEALTNVARHAGAAHCQVTLRADGTALDLEVRDDGQGLPTPLRAGVGVQSMRERAEELGGSLTLITTAQGTCLSARLPLQPGREAAWHPSAF